MTQACQRNFDRPSNFVERVTIGSVQQTSATGSDDDELAYLLIDRLFGLTAELQASIADAVRALELNEAQANLLWQLDQDREAPLMRELADRVHSDPSTVTTLVDRLERRGLVERRSAEHDRRARVVHLTADGTQCRRRLVEIVTSAPLGPLTVSDRRQLLRLLNKAVPRPKGATPRPRAV
jgi:DNA-binding MarR family transcriptional regulator